MPPHFSPPAWLLQAYPPDATGLLSFYRARVDRAMLVEISEADYGYDQEVHLAALERIWSRGEVPAPMQWEPREVLALTRWSEPEDPEWKPGATGPRGYRMRGFACTVLLCAAYLPANEGYFDGENQTLAQLLDSVRAAESDGWPVLGRFLTALLALDRLGEDRAFVAFALLLVALLDDLPPRAESDWVELVAWVEAEEVAVRAAPYWCAPPHAEQWLFGVSFFDQLTARWKALAALARTRTQVPAVAALLDRATEA